MGLISQRTFYEIKDQSGEVFWIEYSSTWQAAADKRTEVAVGRTHAGQHTIFGKACLQAFTSVEERDAALLETFNATVTYDEHGVATELTFLGD